MSKCIFETHIAPIAVAETSVKMSYFTYFSNQINTSIVFSLWQVLRVQLLLSKVGIWFLHVLTMFTLRVQTKSSKPQTLNRGWMKRRGSLHSHHLRRRSGAQTHTRSLAVKTDEGSAQQSAKVWARVHKWMTMEETQRGQHEGVNPGKRGKRKAAEEVKVIFWGLVVKSERTKASRAPPAFPQEAVEGRELHVDPALRLQSANWVPWWMTF